MAQQNVFVPLTRFLAGIFILLLLAGASYQRNHVYKTLLSLWSDAVRKSPMKSRPHNNLGNCYMLLGRHFAAIEEYQKAIELDRNNVEAYYNIASNYDTVGLYGQAAYYYGLFSKMASDVYREEKGKARERVEDLLKQKLITYSSNNTGGKEP